MKKLIPIIFCALVGTVCRAQLQPPTQEDIFEVVEVTYNHAKIDLHNSPYKKITRTTSSFKFEDQQYTIVKIVPISPLTGYIVCPIEDPTSRYKLICEEGRDGKHMTISFSGYKFKCKKQSNTSGGLKPPIEKSGLSDDIPVVEEEVMVTDDLFDVEDNIVYPVPEFVEVEEEVVEEEAIPFQLVEKKPLFQGSDANAFSKWVNQQLVYPDVAKENGVQGRVTLQFTVEKDGRVTNVRVLRGVDPSIDKEAVRVVSMSPKWTPGKQRERPVPVTYTFPVIFQLRSETNNKVEDTNHKVIKP